MLSVCGLVVLAGILWHTFGRANKPAVAIDRSHERKVRDFLVKQKDWDEGWQIYRYIATLKPDERDRWAKVIAKVAIHFRLTRDQTERILMRLEELVRDELGDKTFSLGGPPRVLGRRP